MKINPREAKNDRRPLQDTTTAALDTTREEYPPETRSPPAWWIGMYGTIEVYLFLAILVCERRGSLTQNGRKNTIFS